MPADAEIRAVAGLIYSEMLEDLILSTAIAAHREIKRGRVVCGTCGTKCRAHLPLIPASSTLPGHLQSDSQPPSRTSSPQPSHPTALGVQSNGESSRHGGHTVGPEKGTGGNTGIGSGSGRMDASGNVFFDCLVCSRAISSNRYAPHLSSCLGLNGSTRRGAARSAAVKARMGNGDRSSPSPYLGSVAGSDNGDSDVDSVSGKKAKKPINGNGKRGRSPQKSTPLSTKKSKLSGSVTPLGANLSRGSLPPSKLGRPPTVGSSVHNSSPVNSPSPEFSIISSQSTAVGGKGTTGRKSLPGMSLEMGPESADEDPSYANGGSSSEEADDY